MAEAATHNKFDAESRREIQRVYRERLSQLFEYLGKPKSERKLNEMLGRHIGKEQEYFEVKCREHDLDPRTFSGKGNEPRQSNIAEDHRMQSNTAESGGYGSPNSDDQKTVSDDDMNDMELTKPKANSSLFSKSYEYVFGKGSTNSADENIHHAGSKKNGEDRMDMDEKHEPARGRGEMQISKQNPGSVGRKMKFQSAHEKKKTAKNHILIDRWEKWASKASRSMINVEEAQKQLANHLTEFKKIANQAGRDEETYRLIQFKYTSGAREMLFEGEFWFELATVRRQEVITVNYHSKSVLLELVEKTDVPQVMKVNVASSHGHNSLNDPRMFKQTPALQNRRNSSKSYKKRM